MIGPWELKRRNETIHKENVQIYYSICLICIFLNKCLKTKKMQKLISEKQTNNEEMLTKRKQKC